jgi:hypothetical protein
MLRGLIAGIENAAGTLRRAFEALERRKGDT